MPGPPDAPTAGNAVRYDQLSGLASLRGTLVAVGERLSRERDPRPQPSEPLIWWSEDAGVTWHPAPTSGPGRLSAVVAAGGRFVAVGSRPTSRGARALVLTSVDGRSWDEATLDGEDVQLFTAVPTPAGALLAGNRQDVEGIAPVAFVPDAKEGWTAAALLGELGAYEGEVRGACASGREVTLVGKAGDRNGTDRAFVLRSSDSGRRWRSLPLTSSLLQGTNARANACTTTRSGVAVVGTATLHAYDWAFVSVERGGAFPDAEMLGPQRPDRQAHTAARGVAIVGRDIVVVGYDTSNDDGGDMAVWRTGKGRAVRLERLEALGAGRGVGDGRSILVERGVLVVGGTSADRAVVWRASLSQSVAQETTTTLNGWWQRYGRVDACTLLTGPEVADLTRGVPVNPRLSATSDAPRVSCNWYKTDGNSGLSVELAPPAKLQDFAAAYPAELPPRIPVAGPCTDSYYYPAFVTVVGVCRDTGLAVSGVPPEKAQGMLAAAAGRLRPSR